MSESLDQLILMGFSDVRARKALAATNNKGVEQAMDWLEGHQDDPDIDNEIPNASVECKDNGEMEESTVEMEASSPKAPEEAKSMRCEDCGKVFRTVTEAQWHASKTEHQNFSESTEEVKPLTEEEKKEKMKLAQELIQKKKAEKEEQEKLEAKEKEKLRRKQGQDVSEIRIKMQEKEMKEIAEERKRQKLEDKRAKDRVLEQIRLDREAKQRAKEGQKVEAPVVAKPTVVEPPAERNYDECKLQIRLTNGKTLTNTFGAKEELAAVRLFVQMNRTDGTEPFNMMTTFPRKVFSDQDMETPLKNLGLVPSAVIILSRATE